MCFGPLYSRLVIDKFVPLFSVILGEFMCITGIAIGTYTGTFTVAGPVIQAFAIDLGLQTSQIANRSAIYSIAPKARNRVNTAFMLAVFCGQLMGTAVGNHLYARGGWTSSGSASVGFIGAGLLICFSRGPWEKGWVGWNGGWEIRRRDLGPTTEDKREDIEKGMVEDGRRSDGSRTEVGNDESDETSAKDTLEKVKITAEPARGDVNDGKERLHDRTIARSMETKDTRRSKQRREVIPTFGDPRSVHALMRQIIHLGVCSRPS